MIESRVQEVWVSGDRQVYRLANGQYWEEALNLNEELLAPGVEVFVAPGRLMFTMVALGETELRGVRQIPVVLDTTLLSPKTNLEDNGIHELDGAGYWRVFGMTTMTDRRVLLATPNNVDFWIYTEGEAHNHADPATVFGDGEATALDGGFRLDDGTAWAYVIDNEEPVPDGRHVIVYNLTLHDDRRDDNMSAPFCWYEGLNRLLGPWVVRVQ